MVLKLTYRLPNGKEKVIEAVIDEETSKVYLEPDWQGYSFYGLLRDKRYGDFIRLEIGEERSESFG